jgi:hypothetical protein
MRHLNVLCLHLTRVQGCSLLSVFASSPSTPPTHAVTDQHWHSSRQARVLVAATAFCHLAGDAHATDCTASSETTSLPPHCYLELRNTFASQAGGCSLLVIARVIDVKRCAIHVFVFEAAVAVRLRLSCCRQWLSRQAHTVVTLACNSLATAAASQAIALHGAPPPPLPPPHPSCSHLTRAKGGLESPAFSTGTKSSTLYPLFMPHVRRALIASTTSHS